MSFFYADCCYSRKYTHTYQEIPIALYDSNRSNAAEQRRLAIQESKFLGGDMEHTHLVKGLDFALLQKVCLLVL